MKLLEDRIRTDGKVLPGDILKVDSFLNHQIDVKLLNEMGKEFYRLYKDQGVNKILTVEASGIAIASITAQYFDCNIVFAKKSKSSCVYENMYTASVASFTHKNVNDVIVSKYYISKDDRILIVDDFLALGNAIIGLSDIVSQAGATLVGCGIAVEKLYMGGGNMLRQKGIRVESLAKVSLMTDDGKIEFAD